MVTNLHYAYGIILLATLEAELQELVDRLDRVSRKYSLLINVDKTKVMASDGIVCRILIQTWTWLPMEESVRMTENSNKWRKYVHGLANRQIEDD